MSLAQQLSFADAEARSEDWSRKARGYIVSLAVGEVFTTDSLREKVGDPAGLGNAMGSVIHAAQNSRVIRFTGESVMSKRPEARGRFIRVWVRC